MSLEYIQDGLNVLDIMDTGTYSWWSIASLLHDVESHPTLFSGLAECHGTLWSSLIRITNAETAPRRKLTMTMLSALVCFAWDMAELVRLEERDKVDEGVRGDSHLVCSLYRKSERIGL